MNAHLQSLFRRQMLGPRGCPRTLWFVRRRFYLLLPLVVVFSVAIGSFFGRKIRVDCNRKNLQTAACVATSRTLFYEVERHRVPLDQIKSFSLQVVVSRSSRGRTNTHAPLYIHRERGGWIKLNDYSWFAGVRKKERALARLSRFLIDPRRPEVSVQLGGHLTAFLMIATVLGFCIAGLLTIGALRLVLRSEPGHPKPFRIDVYPRALWGLEITRHPFNEPPTARVDPATGLVVLYYPAKHQPSALPPLGLSAANTERVARRINSFLGSG